MTTQRDVDQRVRAYLDDGPTELPDHRYDAVRSDIDRMRQRVVLGPWTEPRMYNFARFALAAAAVVLVAVIGINLLPKQGVIGPVTTPTPSPSPSPSPTASPAALPGGGRIPGGRYAVTPFVGSDGSICGPVPSPPASSPCPEGTMDDSIRFTFTVPAEGWSAAPFQSIWLSSGANSPLAGAGMIFGRGGWLHSDPCVTDEQVQLNGAPPDVPVGFTVDDFANALANNSALDVTAPVDVTLAGYSGKYVDLQVPSDISACPASYFPWEGGRELYAQGPSHRWHLWILDVDGVRVVVQATDYAGTSPQRQAELRAIVDSIQITP